MIKVRFFFLNLSSHPAKTLKPNEAKPNQQTNKKNPGQNNNNKTKNIHKLSISGMKANTSLPIL
jgi:hypothetical protein